MDEKLHSLIFLIFRKSFSEVSQLYNLCNSAFTVNPSVCKSL